jgi:hypothetical protein
MQQTEHDINPLVDFVKMDRFSVVYHFKCKVTNKSVMSSVPFEPFEGKIEITWQDILFHPIASYNRYYHTPITIYAKDNHNTILLKAFKKVSSKFKWSTEYNQYVSA